MGFRELWEAASSVIIIEQLLNIKNYSIKQFSVEAFCTLVDGGDALSPALPTPRRRAFFSTHTLTRRFISLEPRKSRHFHFTIGSCSLSSHPHSIAASTAVDSARAFAAAANTTILHSSTVCWCIESIKFVFIFASFFHFSRPIKKEM